MTALRQTHQKRPAPRNERTGSSIVLCIITKPENIMRTVLTSYYPNPNSDLVGCAKKYGGIKNLTIGSHALLVSAKETP